MDIIDKKYFDSFKSFVDKHEFFFITGHKEPDGDCVASCLGIAAILDNYKKPYQLLSAGPFKRNEVNAFESKFSQKMKFQDINERKATGLIITDCSEIMRLGEIDGDFKDLDTFIIDHHKTSEITDCSKGYINSASPACAYLVQLFYENLIGEVPEDIAKILFFGICTDTGFFRFLPPSNEASDLMNACSRLIKYGADPKTTYNQINNGKPFTTRKLLGILLSKTELYFNGRLAVTYESLEDTRKYGLEGRDTDSLYQLLLSSKGVEAAVFLRQDTPSTCTGGFRSQDKIDVSIVATKFGGGGHKNASGMSCNGQIEKLLPSVIKEFAKIMN